MDDEDRRRHAVPDRFGSVSGFSLIELLVVISIIALLVGILLPALAAARASAKVTQCLAYQRQVGVGVHAYAADSEGRIPRSPNFQFLSPTITWEDATHNVIWIPPPYTPDGIGRYASHGVLLDGYLPEPRVMLCPDASGSGTTLDQLQDLHSSEALVRTSYMYRNLDQTTHDRVDDLGFNDAGLAATALLYDMAVDIPPGNPFAMDPTHSINHAGRSLNSLYRDGHAESLPYVAEFYQYRQSDYASAAALESRANDILVRLDYAALGDPADAPQLP